MITQERVNYLFRYYDGKIYWQNKTSKYSKNNIMSLEAGNLCNKKGYKQIKVDGKCYLVHHIIYLMHYGNKPTMLDHIDGNPTNNKIENLRECNNAQNQWNRISASKHRSVFYMKGRNKPWYAVLTSNRTRYSKYFSDMESALIYVKDLREKYHGEFGRN